MHKTVEEIYEKRLGEIDVSISTANKYNAQLESLAKKREKTKIISPFFSSEPVDLGYTEASMLDRIVAGERLE